MASSVYGLVGSDTLHKLLLPLAYSNSRKDGHKLDNADESQYVGGGIAHTRACRYKPRRLSSCYKLISSVSSTLPAIFDFSGVLRVTFATTPRNPF